MTNTTAWTDAWDSLTAELDRWAEAGRTATLWWRTTTRPGPAPPSGPRAGRPRRRRAHRAGRDPRPRHPGPRRRARRLARRRNPPARPLPHQPRDPTRQEGRTGQRPPHGHRPRRPCRGLAPDCPFEPLPVLVPPWNRIAPDLIAHLPAAGYTGLSTFNPHPTAHPPPGTTRSTPTSTS